MNNTFLQYILPALLGLIAGIAGTLIAPWVNWGIEKRKIKLDNHTKLLQDVRRALDFDPYDYIRFSMTIEYSRIKNYLSQDLRNMIDIKYVGGNKIFDALGSDSFDSKYRSIVLDELVVLEKKWCIT